MKLQTSSGYEPTQIRPAPTDDDAVAIVQGSFDGWFWAECRTCTWPGDSHRDRGTAQLEAEEHNLACHGASQRASASTVSLEAAFVDYRAGSYKESVSALRKLLLKGSRRLGAPTEGVRSAPQDLTTRALAFLGEIAPRPTQRETAAALMMVGALLGD